MALAEPGRQRDEHQHRERHHAAVPARRQRGWQSVHDSLQKELDLSFEDAESLKLGNKVGTVSEDAKLPILQQVTEIIVLEIQKTFDFFRATAAGEHIEKIYLAGGSSKFPGWWKHCGRSSRCRWNC